LSFCLSIPRNIEELYNAGVGHPVLSLIVDELEPGNGGRNKRSALRRMAIATSLSFGAMRPDGLIAPYKSKLV